MSPPLVSVITPTRNRLGFLRETVASVQSQSFTEWELIVVDDCSQDGTWDWLESLGDERIRPLRLEEHRERAAARNAGLAAARGEYVLFLDDDDWLLEGALARLGDALRREPSAVGAVGAYIYQNNWGSWNRSAHPRRCHVRNIWPDLLFGWMPLPSQTLLRRSAIAQAGGWDEALPLSEDYEIWLRLARLGPAVLIPQAVLTYRIHPGQTARAGTWEINIKLRRIAVANQSEQEKQRAERSILAQRLERVASRAQQRGHSLQALCLWWRAVLVAPWLLASPFSRAGLRDAVRVYVIRMMLGEGITEKLRRAKRAFIRAYRGELRPPAPSIPSTKAIRGTDGRP
ncbi:MAG TPA: glycosyltransferase [Patescibacteria group bacterium]|nr:glycosyltransferase [Patescibacteria group bacterium]